MTKVEAKTGPELIAQIETDANNSVSTDAARVSQLTQKFVELLEREPSPSEKTKNRAKNELTQAQRRLIGTLNIINFFDSLDEESYFGSADSLEMPELNEQ